MISSSSLSLINQQHQSMPEYNFNLNLMMQGKDVTPQ
jgi:hypothetical protein